MLGVFIPASQYGQSPCNGSSLTVSIGWGSFVWFCVKFAWKAITDCIVLYCKCSVAFHKCFALFSDSLAISSGWPLPCEGLIQAGRRYIRTTGFSFLLSFQLNWTNHKLPFVYQFRFHCGGLDWWFMRFFRSVGLIKIPQLIFTQLEFIADRLLMAVNVSLYYKLKVHLLHTSHKAINILS